MAFKTVMTILADPDQAEEVLANTIRFAEAEDAHVEVLCLGMEMTQTSLGYEVAASAAILADSMARAQSDAKALVDTAEATLSKSGLRYGTDAIAAPVGGLAEIVARRARFSDVVMLPLPFSGGTAATRETVLEAVLFGARVPVILLPEGVEWITPKRIVMGWNEDDEALEAARAAIPLMEKADTTHIAIIDPPRHGPERSDPGGLVSQMLSRHGVRCEVDVLAKSMPRISDILQRHVADKSADMLVMGAYGHSRLREAILGGATRHILESAPVPVFMRH